MGGGEGTDRGLERRASLTHSRSQKKIGMVGGSDEV